MTSFTVLSLDDMKVVFRILICAITVDFYYFSSVFDFTGSANTKLLLAVGGLAAFIFTSAKRKELGLSRQMIILTLLAICVSLASLFSMIYNNTSDNTYMSYVISMLVWISAAYMVICVLRVAHGEVSIELIANYIIALSVIQCTIALLGNLFEPVNHFIKVVYPRAAGLDHVNRMYGIGDSSVLDVGGIRYGIACVLCAHLLIKTDGKRKERLIPWYVFSYMYITVIGNMVARTTTVGSVLALVYLVLSFVTIRSISFTRLKVIGWSLAILFLIVTTCALLYNTNDRIHYNLRFGFEGFFSLAERGEWQVSSNNKLLTMYVFPDNAKTWFLGDGYFNNPSNDPNFIGTITVGFYKNTDVGYLRFIYYFGIIGLAFFSIMILYAGRMCCQRFPGDQVLFFIFVLMNFIIWFKVSTDCFFILALFIALSYVRDFNNVVDTSDITQ